MRSHLVLALAFSTALGVGAVVYANSPVAGVVISVEPNAIEIRTANCDTTTVTFNEKTKFMKSFNGEHRDWWPERVPRWQQDIRVNARAVKAGSLVRVDIKKGATPIAETVWITAGR